MVFQYWNLRRGAAKKIQKAVWYELSSGGAFFWIFWWSLCPQWHALRWDPSTQCHKPLSELSFVEFYLEFCLQVYITPVVLIVTDTNFSMPWLVMLQVLADWLYTILPVTFGLLFLVLGSKRWVSFMPQLCLQKFSFIFKLTRADSDAFKCKWTFWRSQSSSIIGTPVEKNRNATRKIYLSSYRFVMVRWIQIFGDVGLITAKVFKIAQES